MLLLMRACPSPSPCSDPLIHEVSCEDMWWPDTPCHLSSVTSNLPHSVLTYCPGLSLLSLLSQVSSQDQPVLQTLDVSPGVSYLCSLRRHRGQQAVGHWGQERDFSWPEDRANLVPVQQISGPGAILMGGSACARSQPEHLKGAQRSCSPDLSCLCQGHQEQRHSPASMHPNKKNTMNGQGQGWAPTSPAASVLLASLHSTGLCPLLGPKLLWAVGYHGPGLQPNGDV